ncbi:MAG: cyclic nucleotide-binding domain-containing protein [Bacteriovoracaceae bacterium]|nr:cyclic nucleotide-binding domain-containing protein [Bacteriovoracaceae bacterium]
MNDSSQDSNFDDIIKMKKGHVLFVEGEPSNYLYIVVSGEIRVLKESGKRLIPISIVRERDFIGELSMFSDEPRAACAVATQHAEVLMIKKTEIRKVIKSCPDWVSEIMITLTDRLRGGIEILREHRIIDDIFEVGNDLSTEEEKNLQNEIQKYRDRRGLS